MKKIYEYLEDKEFLIQIDNLKLKDQYVKITVLNWKEEPIQEIQGIVTGGNINISGDSSMRRTLNLSCLLNPQINNITNINNLLSINKKINLEVGYKNFTSKYLNHPIIWYPLGIYTMFDPVLSSSTTETTLQVSLKDKMCFLDGECGGTLPAAVRFDRYEVLDENGDWIYEYPTFSQIITEVVNHYGNESLDKIIVSDIPLRIKKVMRWIGDTPLYLINDSNTYSMSTNYADTTGHTYQTFTYGMDVGYIYEDFICPSELSANSGETVCSVLDKIKNMLGNYEYFYDINGIFHFQEIKNYLNTTQATIDLRNMNKDNYLIDLYNGKSVYNFNESNLISSYSNSPQYSKIKNDFIVWGIKKSLNGIDMPIRYHLAIDKKPEIGNIYEVFFYQDPDDELIKAKMPIKYTNYAAISANVGQVGTYYQAIDTGYIYYWDPDDKTYKAADSSNFVKVKTTDWRSELYLQGIQADPLGLESNNYYLELINEWPKIYDLKKNSYIENGETIYTGDFLDEVLNNPSNIDYYLDFIDSSDLISQFSISNIGKRTHIISNNDINCIFEPNIPDFVLIELGQPDTAEKRVECENRNQPFIQINTEIYNLLAIGGSSNSAYNEIKMLLHEETSYNENITIQALPIFYLEPNTRISVYNKNSNIYGDYIISNISIPLEYNGTMTINAKRALERF